MADRTGNYSTAAKLFHWLIFLLLAAQYAVGSIMPHIGRRTVNEGWVSWHFSIGAAILVVIVLRFSWRLFNPVVPHVALAPWEALLANFTHYALYALVFIMTSWAGRRPIRAAGMSGCSASSPSRSSRPRAAHGAMRRATSTTPWSMCCWPSSCCMSPGRCITISSSATS